jgi:hypothetical protein
MSDVVPQVFTLLLSATLQIPRITGPHVCAMKIAGNDILETFPTIDQVSMQVIEPGSGCVSQANGEELDDKKVTVSPTCSTCKSVVLQPHAWISFAIVFGDVARCTEMLGKHVSCMLLLDALGPAPRGKDNAILDRCAHRDAYCLCGARCVPVHPPYEPDGLSDAQGIHLGGPAIDRMGPMPVKTRSLPWGVSLRSSINWP